jgi:tetratricopeptide (TPR) repeat protein
MAILWSLDASITYVLLGAGIFFFFLGFWKKPKAGNPSNPQRQKTTSDERAFSSFFKATQTKGPTQSRSTVSGSVLKKGVLPYIIFFSASFLFMTLLPIFFSGENNAPEDSSGYYQKAEEFRWAEQYDSAAFYYERALKEDPANTEILNSYGISQLARNQNDQAMALFDQVLEIDPDHEFARYNKALIYHNLHNYRQSLSHLFKLMDRSPEYYEAMILTGDNYYVQQRYDSAIYWYEQGYDHGERSAGLCHVMAFLYDQKGDVEKAVNFYGEALSYDSTRVEVYTRLGELFPNAAGEQYRLTAKRLKELGY